MKRTVVVALALMLTGCYSIPKHVPSWAMIKKSEPVIYFCAQDIVPRESVRPIFIQVDQKTGELKAIPVEAIGAVAGEIVKIIPDIAKISGDVSRNTVRRNVEFYISGYTISNTPDTTALADKIKVILNRPFGATMGAPPDDLKPGD
jgi:hypothetical protein